MNLKSLIRPIIFLMAVAVSVMPLRKRRSPLHRREHPGASPIFKDCGPVTTWWARPWNEIEV
jgi:hypothetical protein